MKLGLAPLAFAMGLVACSSGPSIAELLPPGPTSSPSAPSEPEAPASADGAPTSAAPVLESPDASSAPSGFSLDASAAGEAPDPEAMFAELPVSGGADAPTISAVTVKCASSREELDAQPSDATFPAAFVRVVGVTDPQGVSDLLFGAHQIVLFASFDGTGARARTFDATAYGAYFGLWELGTFFANDAKVLGEMCTRQWWPGEVTLTDASGHVTRAKVRVPIVH